ncbi:MAG TPA: PilZ domain-containing protein [Kofleriaceae bacterium]|nr:PilZ domain-containing protein [Kofleriaceae bacterium]
MSWIRRNLAKLGLMKDRRVTAARTPIFVGARLELDCVTVSGTARDLSAGGVFFETSAPLAPGLRGHLARSRDGEWIPVRVTWRRDAQPGKPAGIGLAFEAAP